MIDYDSLNTGEYTSHLSVSTWSSICVPVPLENHPITLLSEVNTLPYEHFLSTITPSQTQLLTLSSDPKHRMAHAPAAANSSAASLKLTDISTYVSATVRREQHVEDFSEESGVLQGTKVCSMGG